MDSRRIELHIEHLVLDGFDSSDQSRISRAIERELTRLLTDQRLPLGARGGSTLQADGGSFELSSGAQPEDLGSQVAHAIYRGTTS